MSLLRCLLQALHRRRPLRVVPSFNRYLMEAEILVYQIQLIVEYGRARQLYLQKHLEALSVLTSTPAHMDVITGSVSRGKSHR